MIRLDYRDARPIYEQVRDGLRSLMVTGVLAAGEKLPSVRSLATELEVLHRSAVGRVYTYIIRGKREDILHRMQALSPLLLEAIPLTLEEIFIYELGGADYAVREIIL